MHQDCWDYKIGQTITIPVMSNNSRNALIAFDNKHCGSEYPTYALIDIHDTSKDFLFAPKIESKNLL